MLGLGSLIGQLVEDARDLVRAEIQLARSKASALLRRSRAAIVLLLLAACLAFASLVALLVGLLMQLAPLVGPALGGVIVLIGGLLLSGVLAWLAVRQFAGLPGHKGEETRT